MHPKFEPAPRSIKPRVRKHRTLPVIAIHDDHAVTEDGDVMTLAELIETIPAREPTLFAAVGAADLLARFNATFLIRYPSCWQWRVSDHRRVNFNPSAPRRTGRVTLAVHYFGFRHGNYHKLIDPVTLHGQRLSKLWPGDDPPAIKLMRWATTLRDFCADNNLEVRPTMGGISAQFLTDPRFYPAARRKVPSRTNEVARERLPGNHYFLNVQPSPTREYSAYYIDQHRAHHYHAAQIAFPAANHLYGYGFFKSLDHFYRERTSPDFCGLYCLDIEAPQYRAYSWMKRGTLTRQFVFTNELPHLYNMGYKVLGVRAAWGSHHQDTGINRYARWASDQLDSYQDARWLKPLLLATYGTLACRRTYAEAVFRLVSRGEPVLLLTGRRTLNGRMTKRPMKLEPGIANVIQRGMIDAGTRSESIGLAQWLTQANQRVLSIYADAVMVEIDDDRSLPPLPDPWRIKRELHHLRFINQQAFVSDGMTKLPGVGRELREYRQHAPGYAPCRVLHDGLMNKEIVTTRRI